MSEMEYTEALEFLIKHFPNELVEAVCEGFPTEVMDYIGDKYAESQVEMRRDLD